MRCAPASCTPSFTRAQASTWPGTPSFLWLEVDDVVRECMADVAKGKVVIVPGLQYKALTTGGRMVPRNLVRAMTKVVGKGRGRT